MYHGNNPKALKSQRLLLEALDELMKEKNFQDISVSELCDRSGVSRQTFYKLFETKENLLVFKLEQTAQDRRPDAENLKGMTLTQACDLYASFVADNFELLKSLAENHIDEVLYTEIEQAMSACSQSIANVTDSEKEYALAYMSAGLTQMTQLYLMQHSRPNHRELRSLAYKIQSGGIYRHSLWNWF